MTTTGTGEERGVLHELRKFFQCAFRGIEFSLWPSKLHFYYIQKILKAQGQQIKVVELVHS